MLGVGNGSILSGSCQFVEFVLMQSNTSILELNLMDNWLDEEAGSYICEMLKENCYITHLVSDAINYASSLKPKLAMH